MTEINVVWLKRDIRISDHLPLRRAIREGIPFIVIYCFEDLVAAHTDFDLRHWRFVYQSLLQLNDRLKITISAGDVVRVFSQLAKDNSIRNVFSHQETGVEVTFKRDKELKKFFAKRGIRWVEDNQDGVWRGLRNRQGWEERWNSFMHSPLIAAPDKSELTMNQRAPEIEKRFPLSHELREILSQEDPDMTLGGELYGRKLLQDFLKTKLQDYIRHIGKPKESRSSTSRLSPYLSWGNLSLREVYHSCQEVRPLMNDKRSLDQFMSRLRWRSHFIQRFEMECSIETRNLHPSFDSLRSRVNKDHLEAWKKGETGYPLIDAAMRCVKKTGHLNFRLRATVISFLTHHLWQPWQTGAAHLARCFLDYEPGIHYCQMQMQAGVMGTNTIRIYNPVKQSWEKDPDALFIKEWVPELAQLPVEFIHEPWNMTAMDEALWNFSKGRDYPERIIDHEKSAEYAREKLWSTKNQPQAIERSKQIIRKHRGV